MSNPELELIVESQATDIVFPHKKEINLYEAIKLLSHLAKNIEYDVLYEFTQRGDIYLKSKKHNVYGLSMTGTLLNPDSGLGEARFNMLASDQDAFYGINFQPTIETTKEEYPALINNLGRQIKKYFKQGN